MPRFTWIAWVRLTGRPAGNRLLMTVRMASRRTVPVSSCNTSAKKAIKSPDRVCIWRGCNLKADPDLSLAGGNAFKRTNQNAILSGYGDFFHPRRSEPFCFTRLLSNNHASVPAVADGFDLHQRGG